MPPPSRARWGYPITTPPRPFGVRPALSRRGSTRREGSQGPPPHPSPEPSRLGEGSKVSNPHRTHPLRGPQCPGPKGNRSERDPRTSEGRPPTRGGILLPTSRGSSAAFSRGGASPTGEPPPPTPFPTPFIQRTAQVPTSGWPFRNAPPPQGGRGSRITFARSAPAHVPWAD